MKMINKNNNLILTKRYQAKIKRKINIISKMNKTLKYLIKTK